MSARMPLRAALLFVAAVASVTLAARGLSPTPDLVLVVVIAAALAGGPVSGAAAGLAGGWLLDLAPPGSVLLGLQALLHAAVGAAVGRFRRPGPMGPEWLAVVCVGAVLALEAGRSVLALAAGDVVAVGDVGLRATVTAVLAVLLVPWVLRLEQGLQRGLDHAASRGAR